METAARTSAVDAVAHLLEIADTRGASDIHVDPTEHGLDVRLRCDGALVAIEPLGPELRTSVVGRIKALADLLVYRTDIPQEGRIASDRSPIGSELRVATYPTLLGERVALRLDTRTGGALSLATLGFRETVRLGLTKAIEQPDGLVLLTGPSGSGKTTTLYSCLEHIAEGAKARSIVTIEDPIERRIEGITQTEINPIAGLTFERALGSILRQDPEIILVGEIRDPETAAVALEAGLTGHLVASTIHAGTAAGVFARLLEMGVEPFIVTTAVRGVLAQRLVRKLCQRCFGAGCCECHETGFRGRVALAEWLPMSSELRTAILARADGHALAEAAAAAGCVTLRDEAEDLVSDRITTQQEIDRVLGIG